LAMDSGLRRNDDLLRNGIDVVPGICRRRSKKIVGIYQQPSRARLEYSVPDSAQSKMYAQ
jgi:hypothetical protein